MAAVTILLTSDIHFAIERINPLISRSERFSTFKKIISLAKEHDIFLIVGDLVELPFACDELINEINKELQSLMDSGTEVFYLPGRSELCFDCRAKFSVDDIKTTGTLRTDDVIKSSKGDIFLYGTAPCNLNRTSLTRLPDKGFHIGMFYGDFDPNSEKKFSHCSISRSDIKNMNFDFYALGGCHLPRLFRIPEKILGACAGSPEACSIDETGERFVISMTVNSSKIVFIKRIPVNTISIQERTFDCSSIKSEMELADQLKEISNRDCINYIRLSGTRSFLITDSFRSEMTGFFRGLKIIDNTKRDLQVLLAEESEGDSLKARFYGTLKDRIMAGDSLLSEIIEKDKIAESFSTGGVLFCDS